MKVAMGFWGQPRFFNESHSIRLIDSIIARYSVDVYCHAWWDRDAVNIIGARNNVYPNPPNVDTELQKLYNPVSLQIDPQIRQFTEYGYDRKIYSYGGKSYEAASHYPSNGEYLSAFISQHKLYTMIPWEQYDRIIIWRYDLALKHFPDITSLDAAKMYVIQNDGSEIGREIYDDSCSIMTPKFKELMNLYDHLGNYLPTLATLDPEIPHMIHAKTLGLYDDIIKLPRNEFHASFIRNKETLRSLGYPV